MFAAAMTHARGRGAVPPAAMGVLAALAVAGCGGQAQDAGEPSGHFHVRVVGASFPTHQAISKPAVMRIRVTNADHRALPDVAVTVQTHPKARGGGATEAFGASDTQDTSLAADARPIWVVDVQPKGGETALTNTWSAGALQPGETRTFVWHLVPVKPGAYTVSYAVAPGLYAKARPARGERTRGTFAVRISGNPVPASIGPNGQVVRGKDAAQGTGAASSTSR
jgi:hypothetical protein